ELAAEFGRADDPVARQQLMRYHTMREVHRLNLDRARAAASAGKKPGPEVSTAKLSTSALAHGARDLTLGLEGAYGMLAGDDAPVGPLRRSVNAARDVQGSIHDDATAQRLGLRGGTVAGSVHLDLFPPLLLEVFGPRWFERGSLSINFRNPTVDREAVRAHIRRPPAGVPADGVQVEAWIDREDGMRVGEGTVAVG